MYTSCSTYQLLELNIREEVRTLEKDGGQEIVGQVEDGGWKMKVSVWVVRVCG